MSPAAQRDKVLVMLGATATLAAGGYAIDWWAVDSGGVDFPRQQAFVLKKVNRLLTNVHKFGVIAHVQRLRHWVWLQESSQT